MLQGLIIKKIIDVVIKRIMAKSELRKMRKYVEEDNELDIKVREIGKKLEDLEKLAHPVADFICTDCGTKAKRVKNKLNKLKEKF
jgi:23S rRNA G2445 N2-methylase RlmL